MNRGEALATLGALLAGGLPRTADRRSQQRRSVPGVISVRDHGAKGDGVTDDGAAIQAAHDAGPGFLFFPPGTYRITRTLRITKTTVLQGAGSSMNFRRFLPYAPVSRLLWNGAPNGQMVNVFRVNGGGMRDLALDGNGRAATGIWAQGMQHATWENLSVDNTVAGSSTDAAIVLHGGAAPHHNNVMFCRFSNVALTNVAKGWLLTSGHPDTDICLNVFEGLWVSFRGAFALRIEAGDNNDFINFYQNRLGGTGSAIELAAPQGPQFGARYNYFYHPQGNDAPVLVDTGYVNLAFAYDHSNGLPNPTGAHPENFSQVGTSAADINVKGPVNVGASSGFLVDGTQVVGSRRKGWGRPRGTGTRASFDVGSVTLRELAERLKALIDDLSDHGLIGP